jgi:tellurite resistance protein
VLLVLVQLALLPRYLRLPFSLGFWSFTFPIAAVVADAIVWLRILAPVGGAIVTVVLLAAVTLLVLSIAGRSVRDVLPRQRRQASESELVIADDEPLSAARSRSRPGRGGSPDAASARDA